MIRSFADRATEDLFHGRRTKAVRKFPPRVVAAAQRKLDMLHAARELRDLASPPGNRLEALRGNMKGYHSIRINNQWRIVFSWKTSDAFEVQVIDYH